MTLTSTTTSVITKPVNTVFMQTFLRQAKSRCIHFAGSKAGVVNTQMGTTVATWRRLAMSARGTSSAHSGLPWPASRTHIALHSFQIIDNVIIVTFHFHAQRFGYISCKTFTFA